MSAVNIIIIIIMMMEEEIVVQAPSYTIFLGGEYFIHLRTDENTEICFVIIMVNMKMIIITYHINIILH